MREKAAHALKTIRDATALKPLLISAQREPEANVIDRVLEWLKNNAKIAETSDLRMIVKMTDVIKVGWISGECGFVSPDDKPITVDCSEMRQLARQELVRRGMTD